MILIIGANMHDGERERAKARAREREREREFLSSFEYICNEITSYFVLQFRNN